MPPFGGIVFTQTPFSLIWKKIPFFGISQLKTSHNFLIIIFLWFGMMLERSSRLQKSMIKQKHPKTFIVSDSFCLTIYQQYLITLGITEHLGFEDIQSCLKSIKKEQPKIIFIDLGSDAEAAIDSVKEIKQLYPEIYVVILNNPEEDDKVVTSLKYGAFTNIIKGEKEQDSFQNVLFEIYSTCELLNKFDIRIIRSNYPIN